MKKKTELHPALSAMTTKEYDALWPKPPTPQGIRPLTPMVPCGECERLRVENEALRAVVIAAVDVIDLRYRVALPPVILKAIEGLYIAYAAARENGVID